MQIQSPPQKNLSKCFFCVLFHWSSVHSWLLTKVLKSLQRYPPDSLPPSKHIPAGKEVFTGDLPPFICLLPIPANPTTPWKMKVFLFKGPLKKQAIKQSIPFNRLMEKTHKLTTPPKFNSSPPKNMDGCFDYFPFWQKAYFQWLNR